jgi:hypothetical protein
MIQEVRISVEGFLLDDLGEDFATFEARERYRRPQKEGLSFAEWTVARVSGLSIEIRAASATPFSRHLPRQVRKLSRPSVSPPDDLSFKEGITLENCERAICGIKPAFAPGKFPCHE